MKQKRYKYKKAIFYIVISFKWRLVLFLQGAGPKASWEQEGGVLSHALQQKIGTFSSLLSVFFTMSNHLLQLPCDLNPTLHCTCHVSSTTPLPNPRSLHCTSVVCLQLPLSRTPVSYTAPVMYLQLPPLPPPSLLSLHRTSVMCLPCGFSQSCLW